MQMFICIIRNLKTDYKIITSFSDLLTLCLLSMSSYRTTAHSPTRHNDDYVLCWAGDLAEVPQTNKSAYPKPYGYHTPKNLPTCLNLKLRKHILIYTSFGHFRSHLELKIISVQHLELIRFS
jgi:hypothetical protein